MLIGKESDSFQIGESGKELSEYLDVLLAGKWVVLLVFLLLTASSVYYVQTLEPEYEATSVLIRESENMTASILESIHSYYNDEQLNFLADLQQLMMSRSIASEVVNRLSDEWNIECELIDVQRSISLRSPASTSIFEIRALADDPEIAAALANVATQVFIEKTAEMKSSDLDRATSFLSEQMNLVDEKLRESERKLNAFREKEGLGIKSDSSGYGRSSLLTLLGSLQEELSRTKSEKELTQAQLESVNSLIAEKQDELALTEEVDHLVGSITPQIEQLQSNIAGWQLELATLQETFTDKHYKVVSLKNKIEEAQRRLRSEVTGLVAEKSINPISEWENLVRQAVQLYVQLKGFEHRENLATSKIEQFRKEHPDLLEKEVQLVRLEREARIREKTYMMLLDRYEEMLLLKQVGSQEFSIVDNAIPPRAPISPKKGRIISIGLLVGLVVGIVSVFFLDYIDDTVRQGKDVEKNLGLSIIGLIPKIHTSKVQVPFSAGASAKTDRTEAGVDIMQDSSADTESAAKGKPTKRKRKFKKHLEELQGKLVKNVGSRSPTAESYRSLWTNIQYAGVDKPVKTILITSPGPKEGKSLTTANLAYVMAQSGVKVLVVDADLRRPTIHRLFGYRRSPGLSELLSSDASNIKEFARNTYADNLHILPCGDLPPNPVGILGSEKMKQIIDEARKQFDIVLFDSPPLIAMADASVLASEVDTTLLVLHMGQTKRRVASQAKELLNRLNIDVFGAVLNNIDYSRRYGYYYYYYQHYQSYYSREEKDEPE